MDCDINALSQASRCLHQCLPEGLIPYTRLVTLCAWLNGATGGGTFIPEPTDSQWTWVDSGGAKATASLVGGCPSGADGFQLGSVVSPGDPSSHPGPMATCTGGVIGSFSFGNTVLAVIRWTLGGVPVSNWSVQKSVTLVLDPAVQTYINNLATVRAVFPTIPFLDTGTTKALDQFVKGCRADNIWSKMIEVNCVLRVSGGTNNLQLAMTPLLIGPSGGPIAGLSWQSSGFIEANLTVNGLIGVPASATSAFTQFTPSTGFKNINNCGVSIYCSVTTATNAADLGCYNATNSNGFHFIQTNTGKVDIYCYSGAPDIDQATPRLAGFYSASRTAANALALYFANSTNAFAQIGSTATPGGAIISDNNTQMWALRTGASAILLNTDRRISFIALHDGLSSTETQLFFNRVQEFLVNKGGGFV